jgi:hypothetical protein
MRGKASFIRGSSIELELVAFKDPILVAISKLSSNPAYVSIREHT